MTCILTGFKRADGAGAAYGNTQNVGAFVFSSPTGANGANVPFTLPDYVNATIPLATYLATQSAAGWSNGMMMQWTATGSCCIPSRTTAIKPYTFTPNTYTHIVNGGLDLSSQISGASANALVSAGTYSDEAFSVSPSGLALGYWGYQPIGAGVAALGLTDANLTEFIATQQSEWVNFTTIQSATYAMLIGATPATATTTGVTPYTSSALAQAQIDLQIAADIAAHAGATAVGNVVTWDEAAGTMLSGAGTIDGPTFIGGTDPHSLHATMSMTKNFAGGYDVKRNRVKTYSIRSDGTSSYGDAVDTLLGEENSLFIPGNFPYPHASPTEAEVRADILAYVASLAPIGCNFFAAPYTYTITGTPYHGGSGSGSSIWAAAVRTPGGMVFQALLGSTNYALIASYYVDTSTVSTLALAANAGLTGTSAMSASQEALAWFIPL